MEITGKYCLHKFYNEALIDYLNFRNFSNFPVLSTQFFKATRENQLQILRILRDYFKNNQIT